MDEATEILEGKLYLGGLAVARDLPTLQRLGIQTIVCAAAEGRALFPQNFEYLEFPELVEHSCGIQDLLAVVEDVHDYYRTKQKQAVLIHCVHGRTRSAFLVTYILAKELGWSIQQAYKFLQTKRDVFLPPEWLQALQEKLASS